jgi:hypothetical protein
MGWLEVADIALSVGFEAFAYRLINSGFLLGMLFNSEYGGNLNTKWLHSLDIENFVK